MAALLSRRELLRRSLGGACAAVAPSPPATTRNAFSLLLLGDLHFDRREHHDRGWVAANHPDDLRQIDDYTRVTGHRTPLLFAALRRAVRGPGPRAVCVLQTGDLVEGLCGSAALALRQDQDAVRFIRAASLGVPFLFTKGNHDVTGPGAAAAFSEVFHPFLVGEARHLQPGFAEVTSARYTVHTRNCQMVFYDAYDPESLPWFEAVAARRTATHLFVIVHPPVVPFGARSTWHLYSAEQDASRRAKLLALLAEHEAFVLGGHIHRYSALVRRVGQGQFVQLSTSSVVRTPEVTPRDWLSGVAEYTGDQIRVEPGFSPETATERRAALEAERPFVRSFEYADLQGYAMLTIDGGDVTVRLHAGTSGAPWRTLDLCRLRSAAAG